MAQFFDTYLSLGPEEEELFDAEFHKVPQNEHAAMLDITTSWERNGRKLERQMLEQERQLLEQEREMIEQERQMRERERERAEKAERKLRELGIDPSGL